MTAGSLNVLVEPAAARASILGLGLGNLLLGDDAVGLHLAARLRGQIGPTEDVELLDGGTQGLALLGWLEERDVVIVLDAISLGARTGTVHLLRGDQISRLRARRAASAHEGNALELLQAARLLGQEPREVILIGIEPKSLHTGIGLSPEVEAAVPEALRLVGEVLQEIQQRRNTHVSGNPRPSNGSE